MKSAIFDRFAGLCAMLAGIAIFLYSIAFLVIARSAPETGAWLSALLLLLNGLLATPALTAVYGRLRATDALFALWAFGLGLASALGAAIHGGYDLANAINPPITLPADLIRELTTLPSQIDPRGLLTFGVGGIALLVVAWLIGRGSPLARLAPRAWLWGLSIGDPVAHHLYWALDDPQPGQSAAVGSDPAGRFSGQPHLVYLARSCPVAGSADVK